jgi:hypothetical protein
MGNDKIRPGRIALAIMGILALIALACIVGGVAFMYFLCPGSFPGTSGPDTGYSQPNNTHTGARYVVLDLYVMTLGTNEINILRSDSDNITIQPIHGPYVMTKVNFDGDNDSLYVGAMSSYSSDMYYRGARINVYLPAGSSYDIKINARASDIHVANLSGTNLVVKGQASGNIVLDGGSYDHVYIQNGNGNVEAIYTANASHVATASGRIDITTGQTTGKMNVSTSNGRINLNLLRGERLSIDANVPDGKVSYDIPLTLQVNKNSRIVGSNAQAGPEDLTIALYAGKGDISIKGNAAFTP